jgi:type I restriction enzyme R subunit
LIHRDEINVAYILNLLVSLNKLPPEEAKKRQREIIDLITGEVQLRSKRELIEKFIEQSLPNLKSTDNVIGIFEGFWNEHKLKAFHQMCEEEKIKPEQLDKLIQSYVFANKFPRNQEIKKALTYEPKILESKGVLERVAERIRGFITTYIEGMGGSV